MAIKDRLEIDGRGRLVKVVIVGEPKSGCHGCEHTLLGAFVGCLQHGVKRVEIVEE